MGFNNREIEVKLVVRHGGGRAARMSRIEEIMQGLFGEEQKHFVEDFSKDVYFKIPTKKRGFARIRYMPDGSGQLTVKLLDKGNSIDRVEIDVHVSSPKQATKFMRALLGTEEQGEILKDYTVHFLENDDTTVSVYKVVGDDRIFVEVEARTHKRMLALEKRVVKELEMRGFEATRAGSSLYYMFLDKKGKRDEKKQG